MVERKKEVSMDVVRQEKIDIKKDAEETIDRLKKEIGIQIEQMLWETDRLIYNTTNFNEEDYKNVSHHLEFLALNVWEDISKEGKQNLQNCLRGLSGEDERENLKTLIRESIKRTSVVQEFKKLIIAINKEKNP